MEKHELSINEGMDELTQLLAMGCLRLLLRQEEQNGLNRLKGLDKLSFASNELDTGLTGTEKRGKI